MKNIKSKISMFLVGVLAVTGMVTFVGGTVTAERAEAWSYTGCYYPYWPNTRTMSCLKDYNGWEEFLGYRDYRVIIYNNSSLCPPVPYRC